MATDPLRAGRHSDLVTLSVIADHRAGGMRSVSIVITGKRRIEAARIGGAIVDRIVPVIIVIGVHSVPPTVMRLQSVMGPAHARVCASNNNVLSCEAFRPYLRRVRVIDAGFNCSGLLDA
jgi:hypothetical protein